MRLRADYLALVGVLALGACGDGSSGTPTAVVPTPTPTPVPTPSPTPTPDAKSCTLPPMPDCGASCCREVDAGLYDAELRQAMAAVKSESPQLFNANGSLRVDDEEYVAEVAKKVTELFGLCARGGDERGPRSGGHSISGDEVAIKPSNQLSHNTDIVLSSGKPTIVRHFTCRPAAF